MTIFTLAKTDTYKTSAWKQKLKLQFLPRDVTKIQIGSLNVQQIAQLTGKGIRSQSSGKRFKLPRPATFKIQASYYRPPMHVKHAKPSVSLAKIITNSKKQNSPWETNRTSVSQAIPHILWNPVIHYGFHKSLTQISMQKNIIPVQLEAFLADPFNFILSSISRTFKWFVPHQKPEYAPPSSTPHANKPSSWYDHLNSILQGVQIINLLSAVSSSTL